MREGVQTLAILKIRDVFVKLNYLFPQDMYIINYSFAIGGDNSERETNSFNIAVLEEKPKELLKEVFPKEDNGDSIIYIPSVRAIKDSLIDTYELVINKNKKIEIINKLGSLYDICLDIESWSDITDPIDDESIDILFDTCGEVSFSIFDSPVTVSKKIFPIVNKKTFRDMKLGLSKKYSTEEYNKFVIDYQMNIFRMYLIFSCLPI